MSGVLRCVGAGWRECAREEEVEGWAEWREWRRARRVEANAVEEAEVEVEARAEVEVEAKVDLDVEAVGEARGPGVHEKP